jgi:toxin ParE1/3/4
MARVLRRKRAEDDIVEIWSFIAEDSEVQADNFVKQLNDQFHLLAFRPTLGRPRNELAPSMRSFPIGRYIIFYQPVVGGIRVVRVLHSARDVARIFKSSK